MATFLERYLQGEYVQVWDELTALGAGVRQAHVIDDALDVARETMRRAVMNIQVLIDRLNALGYEFGYPREGRLVPQIPYLPPAENTQTRIHELQHLAGPLPLSLQAWYEVGGEVHFVGKASWRSSETLPDALVIDSVATAIEGVREWLNEWEDTLAEERPTDEPCVAWIAPDEYHKDDISGGLPMVSAAIFGG